MKKRSWIMWAVFDKKNKSPNSGEIFDMQWEAKGCIFDTFDQKGFVKKVKVTEI